MIARVGTPAEMTAKVLQVENLNTLVKLRLDGIRQFPEAFLLTEAEARAGDARLLDWITSGNAFGIFDGKQMIGFAGLRGMGVSLAQHRAHLGPFYLRADYHGSGAADILLAFTCDTARERGATQVELYVAGQNKRARNFYARHGFKVVGQVPNAVSHDGVMSDDYFMVRDLINGTPKPGPDGQRRLTPGDWRAFRKIRLEMLEDTPEFFGTTLAEWSAKAPDEIMDWLDTIHLWAEIRGGRVIATAGWYRKPGAVQAHRAGVIAVYTTPEARGRGLAAALLDALEADARENEITQFELSVGDNNPAARAAYAASGYKLIGTIPQALNYSGTLVDQHEMVKPLTA